MGALSQKTAKDRYEIIVVDNDVEGSADETVQRIKSEQGKIRYERRFSNNLSEARNLGARIGKGEWIAFLDDDCVPNPDWLQTAMELLQENRNAGLVFGGGYLDKSGTQAIGSPQLIYLPKDRYLVEGNCFFRRSEYLAAGGMRADLGPSDKRFGYHEGSELQDRFLKNFGSSHARILFSKLAVHHLESKKAKGWLSLLSGYDSAFAFRSSRQKKSIFNIVRILGCLSRYLLHSIKLNPTGKERELYRAGELFGESAFHIKRTYRQRSEETRFFNNKLLNRHYKELRKRRPATMEDIRQKLIEKKPFLAGKIGGAELLALEYIDHRLKFEWPNGWSWRRPASRLHNNAGFFPIQKKNFIRWDWEMRRAVAGIDFLCAWQGDTFLKKYENALIQSLAPHSRAIPMAILGRDILPEIASFRWLVVSPFTKTMQKQVTRLKEIHDPKGMTSIDWDRIVKTCEFVRCPFQSHLEPSPYDSWEDGLTKLATDVESKEFDVALIGAGAWSLPLGRRIKEMGKSAIHMGGEMQLLFGIKGKRWEYAMIYNSAWVNSDPDETPKDANRVEDGCYW
jgi:glycosyltransferase involved in cell wall biosynthesis